MSKAAVSAAKRQLQIEGYTSFIRALAVNHLDWRHEKLMSEVRRELNVTAEQHLSIVEQVMTDPDITAIREGRPVTLRPREGVLDTLASAQPKAGAPPLAPGAAGRKRKDPPMPVPGPLASPTGASAQQQGGKLLKKGKKGGPGSTGAVPTAPLAPPAKWIGRIVERLWGNAWVDAVVTDYDPARDLHCLTYDLGTKAEKQEWFNVSRASREFRPTQRSISMEEVAKAKGSKAAALGQKKGAKGGKLMALDRLAGGDFEARVRVADSEDLRHLTTMLQREEARVRAELIEIGASDDDEAEEAALKRLTREWDRLSRAETEIRRELGTLND